MKIVFIDVDHTILRHSTTRFFITLAIKRKILPPRVLFSLPFYYMLYRVGSGSLNLFPSTFPDLVGKSEEVLTACADDCLDIYLKKDIHEEAASIIRKEQKAGNDIVLATSSVDFFINPLAEYFNVNYMASKLTFENGLCTGMIDGELNFGNRKKQMAINYARERGVPLKQCDFYSDSYHDLPLLEAVGNPVAVNPDGRLKRIAKKRGWEIQLYG